MQTKTTRYAVHPCWQTGIAPCTGKGWHVYTYHHATWIPWPEELRPWFPSKRKAIAAAREMWAEYRAGVELDEKIRREIGPRLDWPEKRYPGLK